jgi:GT2 family glycosyltransferase
VRRRKLLRLVSLSFLVQVDAFRSAPILYLQGLAWRARGLRVRSRHRLSALAGRSRHAYALWIERNEASIEAPALPSATPPIVPIIDCRQGSDGLADTVATITDAGSRVQPVIIGPAHWPNAIHIDCPQDLARRVRDGSWILPMRPGDRLARHALAAYAKAAAQAGESCLVYADDDLIAGSSRHAPHFKPDWNPELFEHHDFLTGASIVRADAEALSDLPDEDWAEALVRAAVATGHVPIHLRHMLHHRRARPKPVVPAKPAAIDLDAATVTAIIPTRNGAELLRTCVDGLRAASHTTSQTIVVDNGSDDPVTLSYLAELEQSGATVLRMPGPFNYSALNNAAVERATGQLLCFLNNDVEMLDPDWLAMLVHHAIKPDIGAVGARLLYPDGTVQHAGVFTGIGGGAAHAHRFQRANDPGYFERARLPQRVSAVTGACMVVARDKFLAVGGFDEKLFPVAFNDVDLCLKLNSRGWQSFYEPRATLIHHESKSRGSDRSRVKRRRFAGELASLKRVWGTDRMRDPFHHPDLSPFCEEFLVAL